MYTAPSTSRSSRRQSTVNYRISESSNEEPFSPPVSEYLPSSSPSPIADLGNTLPSSILNDFDFSLRDCLGNSTLFSSPISTTHNNLIFIASPTVVFISNPQKTISMGNKDSYENLAVSSGNYIEGVNPLPNDADLEPVSTFWYNAPLPEKSITAAEPETEPTFTSPTRTLLTLESTTVMLREAEPASIACRDEFPLVEHNTAAEPEKELTSTSLAKTPQTLENTPAILPEAEPTSITCYNDETLPVGHNTLTEPETEPISTSPDRTPPVSSIATAIVPHSDPPIIACHVETLPAGYNSTTEPEATNSRPVLVTEANTNPRKRKRNPEKWSQTQKKIKLNTGQQPQKQMQEPCKCKLKCFEKIPSDRRLVIFKQFWACGNHETQWQFILKNTEIIEPKVMKIQRKRERNRTLVYYLPSKNDVCLVTNLKVCKTMFLNTLGIKERTVYTAIDKYANGDQITDLRGKHTNRPHRTASETEQSAIQHIQSFPCIESHYLRQNSSRQYLSQDLNISKMHRLYKDWISENENFRNTKVASEYQYNQIFNTHFNLSFFRPKKDLCNLCSKYDNSTEEGKLQLKEDYDSHIKNKNIIRNMKDSEKESADPNVKTVAVFDLEKVLSLPQSNVNIFHYKRKYPAYNFTVYNLISRQGFCYLWHAQIAKRGANEIASCLLHFIKSEVNRGIKSISLYSDNCSGQNRNRFIFAMYIYVSRVLNVEVTHRFLQTGHTQNEGDSMHACIEKNMKNKTLYSPDQLYEVIMNSKVQNKFVIKEMNQNDFYNLKSQVTTSKNWSQDTNGHKVFFSKIKEIKTSPDAPNKLLFKYDFESEYLVLDTTNRTTTTRTRKSNNANAVDVNELPLAYAQLLPISDALFKDLISLCNTNAIPLHYQTFYRNLLPATESPNLEVFDSSEEE